MTKTTFSLSTDQWLKLIGIILTVATVFIGLYQYFDEQKLQQEKYLQEQKDQQIRYFKEQEHQHKMEFKRKIWQKQLATYSKVCQYSGAIAADPNGEEYSKNVIHFKSLYWGEMVLIEDQEVIDAMQGFNDAIDDYNIEDERTYSTLKFRALQLAEACKSSSERSWSGDENN